MRGTPLLVLAVLLAALLAGCQDEASGAPAPAAAPGASTGTLHGVVVDDAIRPLANATVAVALADGQERSTVTGDDGVWRFTDLPGGAYLVRASKLHYFEAQLAATVTAGLEDPPGLRVILSVDPVNVPAVDAYVFDGFLQCSVTLVAVRAAACNPSEAGASLCTLPVDVCTSGPQNVTEDRFMAVHTISRANLAFLQSEMQWDASSSLGQNLKAIPGSREPSSGEFNDFRPFEGPSPLIMPMAGSIANALFLGNGKDYAVRVFSGYVDGTAPPCLPSPAGCQWGVGTALQQRFSLVTHAFYGFEPPADWQFGRDGLPPVPT